MVRSSNGQGKTSDRRPTNTAQYDWNYIKTYGANCPVCGSKKRKCPWCKGRRIFSPEKYYNLGGH